MRIWLYRRAQGGSAPSAVLRDCPRIQNGPDSHGFIPIRRLTYGERVDKFFDMNESLLKTFPSERSSGPFPPDRPRVSEATVDGPDGFVLRPSCAAADEGASGRRHKRILWIQAVRGCYKQVARESTCWAPYTPGWLKALTWPGGGFLYGNSMPQRDRKVDSAAGVEFSPERTREIKTRPNPGDERTGLHRKDRTRTQASKSSEEHYTGIARSRNLCVPS